MQATTHADAVFARLDVLLADIGREPHVQSHRCIDALLDVYNATPSATVRTVIGEIICGLTGRRFAEAEDVRRIVALLVAAATAESASLEIRTA